MNNPNMVGNNQQEQSDFVEAMKNVDDYETHMQKDFKSEGDRHIEELREQYKMTMTMEDLPEYQENKVNKVKAAAEMSRVNAMGRQYDYMGSVDSSFITREYQSAALVDNMQDTSIGLEEMGADTSKNNPDHFNTLADRQIDRLKGYQEAAGTHIENNTKGFDGMLDALDKHSHT